MNVYAAVHALMRKFAHISIALRSIHLSIGKRESKFFLFFMLIALHHFHFQWEKGNLSPIRAQ